MGFESCGRESIAFLRDRIREVHLLAFEFQCGTAVEYFQLVILVTQLLLFLLLKALGLCNETNFVLITTTCGKWFHHGQGT
jgi:hypothetical protein